MKNDRIDIIIPAFKAHKSILKTLCSIVQQSVINEIDITIVNDCCPEGDYQEFIDMFSKYVSIRELKMEKNSGSAIARQYGLDNTTNEFIVFVDADDTLYGSYAIEILRSRIKSNNDFQCCSTYFQEMFPGMSRYILHQNDMIWLFGKIYRREFIEKNDIRFIDSRASNQDTGFNMLVKLYCNENQICYTDDLTYSWNYKEDSVTRIGGHQYDYDQAICGYVDNMIYVANHIAVHRPERDLSDWVLYILVSLYSKYNMVVDQAPIFTDQTWYYVRKFYFYTFIKTYEGLSKDLVDKIIYQTIKEQNANPEMENVIPKLTFYQFLDNLGTSQFDESELVKIQNRLPIKIKKNNIACGIAE